MNNKKSLRNLILVIAIPAFLFILLTALFGSTATPSKSYNFSDIINYFQSEKVTEYSLDFGTGEMSIKVQGESDAISFVAPNSQYMQERLDPYVEKYNKDHPTSHMIQKLQRPRETNWFVSLLPYIAVLAVMFLVSYLMMRKVNVGLGDAGKQMNFGKAKIKNMEDEKRKTTFADVAGADEEKEELKEIVEFLKNPKKYNELGARIPKGVLLVGPPGTGKTLLARAVAGEAGVPFFSISGSDFVEMFVGVGASRVRDLFEQAKKNSPCIVFIDTFMPILCNYN